MLSERVDRWEEHWAKSQAPGWVLLLTLTASGGTSGKSRNLSGFQFPLPVKWVYWVSSGALRSLGFLEGSSGVARG